MDFIPSTDDGPALDVPYLDEARASDGWQGQETNLGYDRLKSSITEAMARLGGVVHRFQRGQYRMGKLDRAGVQIHYSVEGPGGRMLYGRLDVAALPVKRPARRRNAEAIARNRGERALRMAMYNVVQVLRAQWVLKQLNPGYVPLMPWLLGKGDQTLSELYAEAGMGKSLMPPKGDWVEGDYREAGDGDG